MTTILKNDSGHLIQYKSITPPRFFWALPAQWSQAEHLTLSFEPDEVRLEFTTYQLVQDFAGPWNFMEFTRPGEHTKNYGKSPLLMGKSSV
jgi:hypothetical protein